MLFFISWINYILEKSWTKVGQFKCDDDHWIGIKESLHECKVECENYLFMTFVERGDKNCACQNECRNQIGCGGEGSQSTCDTYKSGWYKIK